MSTDLSAVGLDATESAGAAFRVAFDNLLGQMPNPCGDMLGICGSRRASPAEVPVERELKLGDRGDGDVAVDLAGDSRLRASSYCLWGGESSSMALRFEPWRLISS